MSVVNFLSSAKWEDEEHYLYDFTQKFTLPQVAKITKGQYLNLGAPSLPNPSLSQMVLLAQVSKRLKIAAQCVKFKDGSRVVPVGTKLAIPDNYEGWFEILSEDGRAVRCIEHVGELLRRFPEMCLVRENIKAHLAKTDNAEIISDKTRTVCAGETLVLVSEVHVTPARYKSSGRYLRCFTTKGETIFLSADQKGKFSPVAGEESISGVHTIKNLLSKRFPLMVRLVHGKPPSGLKSSSQFTTEMRLYSLFEEESIMALPLLKDSNLVALPPSVPLKVQAPRNPETLMKIKNFDLLVEKCKSLVQDASDKIHVFDISLSKEIRLDNFQLKKGFKNLSRGNRIKRSASDPNSMHKDVNPEKPMKEIISDNKLDGSEHNYDEIDQIYNYIRGIAPLPQKVINGDSNPSPKTSSTNCSSPVIAGSVPSSGSPTKPEPPPIETIPVRRVVKEEPQVLPPESSKVSSSPKDFERVDGHIYEKVGLKKKNPLKRNPENSKSNHAKLFISHPVNHGIKKFLMQSPAQLRIHQKSKYFKHSPTSKDVPIQRQRTTRSKSLITAPLFNIRYKSLMNLAMDYDSSNSEKKNSYFIAENRRNRMQRPKSLTDLFGAVDNLYTYKNLEGITNGIENRKLIFSQESVNGKLLNGHHPRHIGTLYL